MELGDIVFVRGHGLIPRIIRFFDKGRFSHVCIAMSENTVLEADIGKGVKIDPFTEDDYEIVRLDLTAEQKEKLKTVARRYIGDKYDYRQLLYYVFKSIFKFVKFQWFKTPHEFICSQLVYDVLVEIGALQYDAKYEDITPNELYELLEGVKRQ